MESHSVAQGWATEEVEDAAAGERKNQGLKFAVNHIGGTWKASKTQLFIPLERELKPGSQVIWLSGSHPHEDQQTKTHWLEILAISTAV
ncbi:hypothetical protein AAY473_012372 [Plecturocebus cupreus]